MDPMDQTKFFMLAADPDTARASAARLFESVRARIRPLLPRDAEIRHIGATAIPGCLTKGDLDIVVRVAKRDFAAAEAALACHFARNAGSGRTDDFAAFAVAASTPHLGIQLTARGGALDGFHVFADALRADPDLVRRYNDLKRAHHGAPMDVYRAAKDAFIAQVLDAKAGEAPVHAEGDGAGTRSSAC
jgi:GrpB-like predicted nucleotidyltransferase (UPF0157 family)